MSVSKLLSLFFVVLFAATALAQTSTSRVTGRVVDTKQASIPGATVTITNEATGVSQTQTTTEAGFYAFEALPVGDYTLTIEQSGFKKFVKTGNHVEVNNPLTVDVVLEIGQVSEVVTVQGGPEQLQTANATLGNVVEQKAIETLPLNGRNPLTLLLLEPGQMSAQSLQQIKTMHNMTLRIHEIMQRFSSLASEMRHAENASQAETEVAAPIVSTRN